jgi:hypothetical protein
VVRHRRADDRRRRRVSAFEWHVIYALPDGGLDHFAAFAPQFAGDATAMTSWWLGQDPTRKPRFDLIDTPELR